MCRLWVNKHLPFPFILDKAEEGGDLTSLQNTTSPKQRSWHKGAVLSAGSIVSSLPQWVGAGRLRMEGRKGAALFSKAGLLGFGYLCGSLWHIITPSWGSNGCCPPELCGGATDAAAPAWQPSKADSQLHCWKRLLKTSRQARCG